LKREMDFVGAEMVDSLPVDLPTLPEPILNQLDSNEPPPPETTDANPSSQTEEDNEKNIDIQC